MSRIEPSAWTIQFGLLLIGCISLLLLVAALWGGMDLKATLATTNDAATPLNLDQMRSAITLMMWITGSLALLVSSSIFFLYLIIRNQSQRISGQLDVLSTGDLSTPLADTMAGEFAAIGSRVNVLTEQLDWMLRMIRLQARTIAAVVAELDPLRDQLYADSLESKNLSEEVTQENDRLDMEIQQLNLKVGSARESILSASEISNQLADEVSGIASSVHQADGNVSTMADAAEEMTANIDQVNDNLSSVHSSVGEVSSALQGLTLSLNDVRARYATADQMSKEANQQSQSSRDVMSGLNGDAQEVFKAVKSIRTIADQTNMLALNAAIESAGAGEAGRGFAVVANEVKELAGQTAQATTMIEQRITRMQERAGSALEASQQVDEVISRLAETNQAITEAVDDQAHGVQEIQTSMESVTRASDEVTRNAAVLSHAAQEVARSALEAAAGTRTISEAADRLTGSAQEVAKQGLRASDEANGIQIGAQEIYGSSVQVQKRMIQSIELMEYLHGSVEHVGFLSNVINDTDRSMQDAIRGYVISDEPFDIQAVKQAHLAWLGKLEQVIRGRSRLKPEEVATGRDCAFGKWYYTEGEKRFGALTLFQDLGEDHLKVHEMAREVVALANALELEAASEGMQKFDKQRIKLFDKLDQLYMVGLKAAEGAQSADLMPWNSHLETSIQEMDEDHRKLVDMVNRLYHAILKGDSSREAKPILVELIGYTQTHFQREEAFLRQNNFPHMQEHQQHHIKLMDEVELLKQALESGEAAINLGLVSFIKDWLTSHIIGEDKKYGQLYGRLS
uniref:Putative Methyl-accepting chemotaxis protein n=1 Tax=Magnetococcus massalia (strain MO-1) TaxID=451514 RepID=A0A1S7LEY8_MAGMO|nr:putative Methyl-accepting chemotaxis protein [Candidatus Magnetococcus massalia]